MISSQQLVERALAHAGKQELVVRVTQNSEANLRWASNSMTTNGMITEQQVDIVAFATGSQGRATATTSAVVRDETDIVDLVEAAQLAAGEAIPGDDTEPLLDAGVAADWDEGIPHTDPTVLTQVAEGLGEAFERALVDGVEHFGYAEHSVETVFLGATTGTRLRFVQPTGRLEMTAKSHQRSRSAWVGTAETDMTHISVSALDAGLRQALAWQGRTVGVAPGRHPTLLSPSAVADLMVDLYWSADARSAIDGSSVFARPGGTRVGERLGSPSLTLSSDPADPVPGMRCADFEVALSASGSASPADNGLPLSRTDWISAGVLDHLVTTRHTAAEADLPVTPGIDNLTLTYEDGEGGIAELAERMGEGLLVTCLWYNRVVDPQTLLLTGLTRDGVYVVRDGEIAGTCGNFRFNDSPVGILARVRDGGRPERTLAREMGDYFNRAVMPALVVEDFNMSTASQAL